MSDYANFRQRLDTVLRTLDVKQVQDFLISQKQWEVGQPADPEFAMWMIAGSLTLRDLHNQARKWLVSNGHAEDADAVLKTGKSAGNKQGKGEPRNRGSKGQKSGSKFQAAKPQKNRRTNGH